MFLPLGDNVNRREFPFVPIVLVVLNVLAFALELRIYREGDIDLFFHTWGLVPFDLREGNVTGLLSHMFLHGSFAHILGNMMFLWAFSCSLEISLGRSTLLAFYIMYGIVAGLAHSVSDFACELPMVGASGAVAGLMGAYLMVFGVWSRINVLIFLWFVPVRLSIPSWCFCLGWIGLQLWSAQLDPQGTVGVAWYAHIGGFFAGMFSIVLFGHLKVHEVEVDRYGELRMVSTETEHYSRPVEPMEEQVADRSGPVTFPWPCPHCATMLNERHLLAETLLQCDSPACGRMIYLEHGVEVATSEV